MGFYDASKEKKINKNFLLAPIKTVLKTIPKDVFLIGRCSQVYISVSEAAFGTILGVIDGFLYAATSS
jgi:hypothetical protein